MPQDAGFPEPPKNPAPSRRGVKPVAGRIDPSRRGSVDPHPAGVPAGLSSSPDIMAYVQALRRHWVVAAALGGTLALVAAAASWFLMSPKYIAFGKVRVAFEPPNMTGGQPGGHGDFLTYLKTQSNLIMSRPVVTSALKRDEVKRLNLEAMLGDPVQFIDKELKVEFQDSNELLTITLGTNDPRVSLALVKAIIDSYMEDVIYAEKKEREERVSNLEKAFNSAKAELKSKQEALNRMASESTSTDPALQMIQLNDLQQQIQGSRAQQSTIAYELAKAEADLATHEARMEAVKEMAVSPAIVESSLKADPKAQALQKIVEKCQDVIDDFEQKAPGQAYLSLTSMRDRMRKSRAAFAKRKQEIKEELARAAEAGGAGGREEMEFARVAKKNSITAFNRRHEELDKLIAEKSEQLTKIKLADHNGQDSLREHVRAERDFVNELSLKKRREEVELMAVSRVTKTQDAELQKKDTKKQIMATAISPVMMLLAVGILVAWLDVRQRRIRSAGEVARGLGIRVVGAVPSLPNLEHHLIGPNGEPDLEGHPALESIDALRTMLLRDADDEETRLVMVTSATHGEGKTTVASHLASSLARAGRKTLLIDGDLRRPSAHQLFELPMHPGFSEVLLAEVELTDAVQATTLEGLSFMAAGQWDREVMQALARDGVEGIFEKLEEEFDFVVIDSHPVLPATDSLLIGQRVDAVILSVLREVSQMPRVFAASQRLTTLGIRVLGAVVNGADPEEALAATASARMVAH
jgi:capsular exopolysaccharide synthesis family protein